MPDIKRETTIAINNSEINEIVATILSAVPALEIYLFGSYASGTAKENSDDDFYVIIPDGMQAIESLADVFIICPLSSRLWLLDEQALVHVNPSACFSSKNPLIFSGKYATI